MRARGRVGLLAVAAAASGGLALSAAMLRPDGSSRSVASGADLFVVKGCATCHNSPDSQALVPVGPSLADAAGWASGRRDGLSAGEYLTESMLNPGAFISPAWTGPNGPTTGMPTLSLSADEVAALVEYLLEGDAEDPEPDRPGPDRPEPDRPEPDRQG